MIVLAEELSVLCCASFPPQTHPNVDKKLFLATSQVGLKNAEKPFPLNQEVGILKWRLQTQDEALIPLSSQWQPLLCVCPCVCVCVFDCLPVET